MTRALARGRGFYGRSLAYHRDELRRVWRDFSLTGADMLVATPSKRADARTHAAHRAVWVRLVRWFRAECAERFFETPEPCRRVIVGRSEALTRGTSPGTGKPYRASELKRFQGQIRRAQAEIVENLQALQALSEMPIPTYREWRR